MNWPKIPLRQVAPSGVPNRQIDANEVVWQLTLDQIESNTGCIVGKKYGPAGEAGSSTNVFDENNVLYSKLRPYLNKVVCPQEPGIATTELVPLRPKAELLNRKYLTYYLRSPEFVRFASATVAGVKMPRIIMSKFWDHELPLPPLREQRRIVEILDQADALRKQRAEADAKAARILPALFYQMFGDPMTNPKGWPIESLGQFCSGRPQYGANAKAIEYKEGMPRYVRITDINERGQLIGENFKTLDSTDWEQYQLVEGDLLFARSGATVGKSYMYREQDGLCAFAGYLIRFQLDRNKMNPWVVFAYTQTPHYKNWVVSKQRAAAQPNINGQEYASLLIMRPEPELQQQFANSMVSILEISREVAAGTEKMENLFGLLLHRAFSGELTAKWREAHMKELLQEIEHQARALG